MLGAVSAIRPAMALGRAYGRTMQAVSTQNQMTGGLHDKVNEATSVLRPTVMSEAQLGGILSSPLG